ncbi:MAG: hypothetical protein MZV64_58705 [Ignavibacteriales bacterium]|nr:hypothetical protein [Ignavibacteriales bacterium]
MSDPVHLQGLTELNLVGSQWQNCYLKDDSDTMLHPQSVREDNPELRQVLPGLIPNVTEAKPDEEVYGNEQSLNLILTESGAEWNIVEAVKISFTVRSMLFNCSRKA